MLFQVIYDRYASIIYRKCLSFTTRQADAEDLTHDILLKAYLNLSKFEGRSRFSTWLYSITYNFCVDYKRAVDKGLKNFAAYAHEESYQQDEPSDEALFQIKVEKLRILLEQIDPEDKALLLMKYRDELPIKNDIMEITKLTEGAVKMRLKRCKEKIIRLSKNLKSDLK